MLEKGWIGSGNAGRNTTIIRSNYGLLGNTGFYELSMKLRERMEQDLNYNAMVSQRGVLNSTIPTRSATPSPGAATRCASAASMPSCSIRRRCARCCRS
ncbi:FAD-dependent oxidoreductase [Mesorhizobium atlanticum]